MHSLKVRTVVCELRLEIVIYLLRQIRHTLKRSHASRSKVLQINKQLRYFEHFFTTCHSHHLFIEDKLMLATDEKFKMKNFH